MNKLLTTVILSAAALLSGCASTVQVKDYKPAGFLGDYYSLLQPGEGPHQAALRYQAKGVDLGSYRKIIFDPVMLYGDTGRELSAEDRQAVADNFYIAIRDALSKDHEIVDYPGPNTARMQVAIVEVTPKSVVLDTVSTIVPVGLAVSSWRQYKTGRPTFTGSLGIEVMFTDSLDDRLLTASVDTRAGGKRLSGDQFNSWSDVNNIISLYAEILRFRVCQVRGNDNCTAPSIN